MCLSLVVEIKSVVINLREKGCCRKCGCLCMRNCAGIFHVISVWSVYSLTIWNSYVSMEIQYPHSFRKQKTVQCFLKTPFTQRGVCPKLCLLIWNYLEKKIPNTLVWKMLTKSKKTIFSKKDRITYFNTSVTLKRKKV